MHRTTDPAGGEAAALARLAHAPDAEAWAIILERMGPRMQRVCARLTGNESTADDALQESLLQVRDHADAFAPPGAGDADAAARAWILRVATTTSLMLMRRQRLSARHQRDAADHDETTSAPPEAAMERDETNAVVRTALAAVPEPQRMVLAMHHIAGLPLDEVASALRLPVGTVKSRLQRGREDLRRRLRRVGIAVALSAIPGMLDALPHIPHPPIQAGLLAATRGADPSLAVLTSTAHLGLSTGILMATTLGVAGIALLATFALHPAAAAVAPPSPAPAAEAPAAKVEPDIRERLDQEISLDFQDTPFADTIRFFAKVTGVAFTIDPKVTGAANITLRVEKMKIVTILDYVARLTDTRYTIADTGVLFQPAEVKPGIRGRLDQLVSFEFDDTPLAEVAAFFAQITGMTFDIDPKVTARGVITFKGKDMRLITALNWVAQLTNTRCTISETGVLFQPAEAKREIRERLDHEKRIDF